MILGVGEYNVLFVLFEIYLVVINFGWQVVVFDILVFFWCVVSFFGDKNYMWVDMVYEVVKWLFFDSEQFEFNYGD